jgi:hypothetical protein
VFWNLWNTISHQQLDAKIHNDDESKFLEIAKDMNLVTHLNLSADKSDNRIQCYFTADIMIINLMQKAPWVSVKFTIPGSDPLEHYNPTNYRPKHIDFDKI